MIKRISPQQAYPLRQAILRPDGNLQDCMFDGDELPDTHHWGYFDDEELVAIASVYQRNYQSYQGHGRQLRSMAVSQGVQGKGVGQQLLTAICEYYAATDNYLWANARVSAIAFYRRANFNVDDTVFDIAGVGPHQHIVKWF
ncbi:GNAT family N-acetyltransferase [Psychrobium sp. MM17-31]|uniref:GNAT family N-acetyltransferase n=1 Tax=Psychrobium sp. MM17-31 TaxID=2917758 RepID=UPI001EF6D6F9|nr:GNAT family N-acetyltransferase [Psychrobium sp. MM17-31]MCG7529996.1 GNAT family N-acetyltransferase [Psychrobium sp. MM17-31]